MKQILLSIALISISIFANAQEERTASLTDNITIRAGHQNYSNTANENNFYDYKYGDGSDIFSLTGLSFDVMFPSKIKSLNYIVGTIVVPGFEDHGSSFWVTSAPWPIEQEKHDYQFNGGGIYGGINAQVGHKNIGLDMTFGAGIFSFKKVDAYYNSKVTPVQEVYDIRSTQGLGATASIGLYLKIWRFTLSPSWQYVYSGGNDFSVLLPGFYFPVSFRF